MQLSSIRSTLLLSLLLPATLAAQDAASYFTPTAGAREFTFGASGTTNQDFDNSAGGLNASYGYYLGPALELVFRQSLDYINPDEGSSGWAGSSRVALDYHFAGGERFRPFVGVSLGGIYGDTVEETWTAGLEVGGKYYVRPSTFLFAMADYSWLFDEASDVEDRFDDGAFFWSAGVGFNF